LSQFGRKTSVARRLYSEFVDKGIGDGKRPDLVEYGPSPQRVVLLGGAGPWHQPLELAKRLGVSQPTASQSVKQGDKIVEEKGFKLMGR
jgi:hypothetical protein